MVDAFTTLNVCNNGTTQAFIRYPLTGRVWLIIFGGKPTTTEGPDDLIWT